MIFLASLLVFFTRSRAPTGTVATAGRLTTMSAVLAPTRIRSPLVKSAAVRVVSAAAARVSRRGPSSAKLASLTRPVVAAARAASVGSTVVVVARALYREIKAALFIVHL